MKRLSFLVFGMLISFLGLSQINLKVGYNAQYNNFAETNKLFSYYNTNTPEITTKYNSFHFMHGLELGARYLLSDRFSLGIGAINVFTPDNKTARTINSTIVNDEWRINNRYFYLGFENVFGSYGYGVDFGYSQWKYLKDFVGASGKEDVMKDNIYNVRFSFILQATSGNNAFALKPYYNYPLSTIDISDVGKALNPNSSISGFKDKFGSFGLSIIFYNGPQRN